MNTYSAFTYLTRFVGLLNRTALLFLLLGIFFITGLAQAEGMPQLVFIFDASGSMWGKAGDKTKIEAAKEVMNKIVPELPSEVGAGLTVYGHRKKGDCSDIEVLIPPENNDREKLLGHLESISPKGKTPIAHAVKTVADQLKGVEEETVIVLISDGEETCHTDPCGVVKSLKKTGIKFVLHIVGFDVNDKQKAQLACLADAGGGLYFGATDTQSLLGALESVKQDVAEKVEKAKTTSRKTVTKLGKLQITLPGVYNFSVHYKKMRRYHTPDIPVVLGEAIEIKEGKESVVTIDSGIQLKKAQSTPLSAWELIPTKGSKALLRIEPASNGDYPLWKPYAVPPGTYDLLVFPEGMTEPLPVAEGLLIKEGELLHFDAGI